MRYTLTATLLTLAMATTLAQTAAAQTGSHGRANHPGQHLPARPSQNAPSRPPTYYPPNAASQLAKSNRPVASPKALPKKQSAVASRSAQPSRPSVDIRTTTAAAPRAGFSLNGIGGGGGGGGLGSIVGTASDTLKKNVTEPLGQATTGFKQTAGQATAILKNTAGQATTTIKQTAGQTVAGVKQTAGQAAAGVKNSAGQATATVKQSASQAVAGVKHTIGQTTNTIKRTGGQNSDWSKEHVNKPIGQAVEQVRAQGGKATDWNHEHINKPVGEPWNRGVRDPWERYLNRIVSTAEDRWNQAADRFQTGVVDGTNRVPQENAGREFNYQNVPNWQVTKSREGSDIIAVNAPNGGTVGFDVSPGFEGREVTMTMVVMTEPGNDQARIALGQDDGQVIETSKQASKVVGYWTTKDGKRLEIRELTMTTRIPSDEKDYGRTDSAHDYRALLQLDQGANVQVVLGGVQLATN